MLSPIAKTWLKKSILRLREHLLKDLQEGVESRYKWTIKSGDAILNEQERERRRCLESWLRVQVRAATPAAGETASTLRHRVLSEAVKDRAATLLSRMIVVRQMEALGLTQTKLLTGGWNSPAYRDLREFASATSQLECEGYALLCQLMFDELSSELPSLFLTHDIERLLPISAAMWREMVETLDAKELPENDRIGLWQDDTLLGWTYQYWNDPDREALDAKVKDGGKIENHEIAAKTQLFTDRYIVEWTLQNALGQLWLGVCQRNDWKADVVADGVLERLELRRAEFQQRRERGEVSLEELMPLETPLEERWKYWVARDLPVDTAAYAPSSLRELRLLDPACGSGHFLVIALDLLVPLYEEEARHRGEVWSQEQIAHWILEKNLHGLDIDARAVRIAHAALWLKARRMSPGAAASCPNLVATDFKLRPFEPEDPDVQAFFDGEIVPRPILNKLLVSFRDAEHLGTLVPSDGLLQELDGFLHEASKDDDRDASSRFADRLGAFVEAYSCSDPLEMNQCGDGLRKTKAYLSLVNRDNKYHLVVGNPPYQNRGKLADGKPLERHCPQGKVDLYSAFLYRALELTREGGISSLLTLRGWMFLSSFSGLRKDLLERYELTLLGDLDRGAFEDILDEVVSVAVSCFRKVKPTPSTKSVAQLPTPRDNTDRDNQRTFRKIAALVAGVERNEFYTHQLAGIPNQPLVYWWRPEFLVKYASSKKLGDEYDVRVGLQTSNNTRFLRAPWEVRSVHQFKARPSGRGRPNSTERWAPFVNGAGGQTWFEPLREVIQWTNNGLAVKSFAQALYGSYTRTVKNEAYYLVPGVAFSPIGASFTARIHRFVSIFGHMGSSVFPPADIADILCMMNSQVAKDVLNSLNPGVHYEVGDVNRLPFFSVDSAEQIVAQLEDAFTQHEQARETSVEFVQPCRSAWHYAQQWAQTAVDRREGTRLPPFDRKFTEPSSLDRVSYAIGLAIGRFHPADRVPTVPAKKREPISSIADHDPPDSLPHGILFLTDRTDSLDHPACERLRRAWEDTPLDKGLLRDYLKNKFFSDDHLKRYEKRPIYFPLSSSNRTFVAYISIHRWTSSTLEHLLADHIHPELHRLSGELNDLAEARSQGDVKSQGQAQARYDQVSKLLVELQDFADLVRAIGEKGAPPTDAKCPSREVDVPFEMDLDDGVMINSAALWPLLEPQWKDPKKWWKELSEAKGKKDYDWAHLARRYWPTRVDAKCQTDPSLAVAHACFWKYHPAKAYEWELRLQAPEELGPDFTLDEPDSDQLRQDFEAAQPEQVAQIRENERKRRLKKPRTEINSGAPKAKPPKTRPPLASDGAAAVKAIRASR